VNTNIQFTIFLSLTLQIHILNTYFIFMCCIMCFIY